jgi:hypothetical protein
MKGKLRRVGWNELLGNALSERAAYFYSVFIYC